MAESIPRETVERLARPHPLRRLSMSLPQMALLAGIVMRLWRLATHSPGGLLWVGGTELAGIAFLFVMVSVHLANHTLRTWVWRAPVFAALEAGTEMMMSLALTAFGLEFVGADTAELADWLPTAQRILLLRVVGVSLFAVVLGAVVWVLRRVILVADHRAHTAAAIHRATMEHEAHKGDS